MIDSLSRAGLVPATSSSAPAASVRAPVADADADASAEIDGDSGEEGVTTSIGGPADPSPTYGPTGRFDVAVIAGDDADPDVDATETGDEEDASTSASADVGTAGRAATAVREYLAVWGSGSPSGEGEDGGDADTADAGGLSVTA